MEQTWVTDKFYSHFPSYTDQQQRKRAILIETRKQDYQNYLKQMSTNDVAGHRKYPLNSHRKSNGIENGTHEHQASGETFITRAIIETSGSSLRKNWIEFWILITRMIDWFLIGKVDSERGRSSRLRDSKHMDLPDIFDDEAIRERNRKVVEVIKV